LSWLQVAKDYLLKNLRWYHIDLLLSRAVAFHHFFWYTIQTVMTIISSAKVKSTTRSLALFVFDTGHDDVIQTLQVPARIKRALKKIHKYFPSEPLKVGIFPINDASIDVVVVVNIGKKKDASPLVLMRAFRAAARALSDAHQKTAAYIIPDISIPDTTIAFLAAQHIPMALYAFSSYRKHAKKKSTFASVELVFPHQIPHLDQMKKIIAEGKVIAEEINSTRDLSNTPGGDMTPTILADHAQRTGKRCGFRVTVLSEKQMKELGMGGVLGVSRGSIEEAKFIVCEYAHPSAQSQKPVVFVGKGITFDSGGLNIKPETGMYEMHLDMSGGAAVIHTIAAIARLKIPVKLVGLIPAVENMPGGSGYRPGDILRSYNGKTIEVKNTDAEGRIILADALGYAKKFKPECIIDVATLSGSTLVALGQRVSALLSPDKKLSGQLVTAGEASGDRVWPLPLWPEYKADLASDFADVANITKTKFGGTITAGMFLWEFTPTDRWAHIDIASTMTVLPEDNLAPGAKGSGVNLLVTFIKEQYGDSTK
jgi:leucyl aminopeptidase